MEVAYRLVEIRGVPVRADLRSGIPRSDVLFPRSAPHTSLFGMPGEATAELDADNVGNAYVWLHLAEDVELAIDRYRVRPGW